MKIWQAVLAGLGLGFLFREAAGLNAPELPSGKGVFITSLYHQGTPDPAQLVTWLRTHDISWVAIEVFWENLNDTPRLHNTGKLAEYAAALNAAGIRVWIWGYPAADDEKDGVADFVERVRWGYSQGSIAGVLVDAEKAYYSQDYSDEARATMLKLVALGKPVGVTSYGRPSFHPKFPWKAWATGASFGVPQIYSNLGPDYGAKAEAEWKAAGFPAIVPAFGGSSKHTPSEMKQLYAWAPKPNGAAIWWSLRHLLLNNSRAEAVRDVPPPGGMLS